MEDAKVFRANLKLPLIYVGGMVSKEKMEEVLDSGFVALQMARALINDTDFVNKLHSEYHKGMTQEEVSRFDAARLEFMKAVNAHGSEELAIQIKEAYGKIVE